MCRLYLLKQVHPKGNKGAVKRQIMKMYLQSISTSSDTASIISVHLSRTEYKI